MACTAAPNGDGDHDTVDPDHGARAGCRWSPDGATKAIRTRRNRHIRQVGDVERGFHIATATTTTAIGCSIERTATASSSPHFDNDCGDTDGHRPLLNAIRGSVACQAECRGSCYSSRSRSSRRSRITRHTRRTRITLWSTRTACTMTRFSLAACLRIMDGKVQHQSNPKACLHFFLSESVVRTHAVIGIRIL
jgi:hypothetical protein